MEIEERDIEDKEFQHANDPLELMGIATKVHTKNLELNEDATLSDLSQKFPKLADYTIKTIEIISVLGSFLRKDDTIIRYSNFIEHWGKPIEYRNPEKKHFEEIKALLMARVNSTLILSRSCRGSPLKAFLTYGRDVGDKQLGIDQKQGIISKILGKKQVQDEML